MRESKYGLLIKTTCPRKLGGRTSIFVGSLIRRIVFVIWNLYKMALIGFARVSTQSQSLLEQENALKAFGCTKIFSGKHSGKASDNKQALDELLSYVRR